MRLIEDNDTLLAFVPNNITAVRGEQPLFERICPSLVAAELWAEANFFSKDCFEEVAARGADDDLRQAAAHLVATEALRRAVPSLDVVFTPNGFAVTQTNNLAPASKQRVDRLIGSLLAERDRLVEQLLRLVPSMPSWADSHVGRFFAASLFPNIDLPVLAGSTANDRWEAYLALRPRAIDVEEGLGEEFVSPELLRALRRRQIVQPLTDAERRVVGALRAQVVAVLCDRPISTRAMMDVVNFIRHRPDDFPGWHSSATARLFSPPKFENKKSASGYWF